MARTSMIRLHEKVKRSEKPKRNGQKKRTGRTKHMLKARTLLPLQALGKRQKASQCPSAVPGTADTEAGENKEPGKGRSEIAGKLRGLKLAEYALTAMEASE
eukprot:GHVU01082608.1.p1 GENE.GHVU01082608.1~~GHVU01082608.1.p1  ORF type:complete len:102 (+),score=14.08 GHVU01082608.1:232-537(+)